MAIVSDPLGFWLPPPDRLYHFAEQPLLTRWRIEGWESLYLKYTPTEAEIEARWVRVQASLARAKAKEERLLRFTGRAAR